MAKRKHHTEGEIIRILREAESGLPVADLLRKHNISQGTYYRWKSAYSGMQVSELKRLKELEKENARLKRLVADQALDAWTYANKIEHHFIQPGKPNQNAYVESFNGKVRDECLNEHWWRNIDHARNKIERRRQDYNRVRPHSSLKKQTPEAFAQKSRAPLGGQEPANRLAILNPKPEPTPPVLTF